MSLIQVRFEAGRESITHVIRVPPLACNAMQCSTVPWRDPRGSLQTAGDVLVEKRRNDGGVLVSIVLPTGYPFPTGRTAPEHCWVPMLKSHLRYLLGMPVAARLLYVANVGIENVSNQIEVGKIDVARGRAAIVRLERIRAEACCEIYEGATEDVVLDSFYTWLSGTAALLKISQRDLLNTVDRSIRGGRLPKNPNPDIDPDIANVESVFQRSLDI